MVITQEKHTIFLDDLGGEEREINIIKSTTLSTLINIFHGLKKLYLDKKLPVEEYDMYKAVSNAVHNYRPEFNLEDLTFFIHTFKDNDFNNNIQILLGTYTGALLDFKTYLNNLEDKETYLYLNGEGSRFKYLFYNARNVDKLILDNWKGDCIGSNIANRGEANFIALLNCEGNWIGSSVGKNGILDNYFAINNKGDHCVYGTGNKGESELIVLFNNEGKDLMYTLSADGKAKIILSMNNYGEDNNWALGYDHGEMEYLILKNNKGKNAIHYICNKGNAEHVFLLENKSNDDFYPTIKNLYTYKNPVKYNGNHIKGKATLKAYQNTLDKLNLNKIVQLADNPEQCKGEVFAKRLIKMAEEVNL
ncbi:hypothetical protein ACFL1H_05505 [Nanoarchaeota archaeon]